jgi:hypothetical protein
MRLSQGNLADEFWMSGLNTSDFEAIRETAREETAAIQYQADQLLITRQSSSASYPTDRQRLQTLQSSQLQKKLHSSRDRETNIETIMKRVASQRQIISEAIDIECLLHAFQQFNKLQQVRLMPLSDLADIAWERYLNSHQDLPANLRPSSSDAFRRSAQSLSLALLKSGNNAYRFSSRAMDLGTPIPSAESLRTTMCSMAERFTGLDLQFVYRGINIDDQLRALSELFLLMFQAAVKLKNLHVGFGFGRRVSIPLELVFHGIHFKNLDYLGIHEWHVHAEELIGLLDRHKHSLRRLRLRHISLKEEDPAANGHWTRVLQFIRWHLRLEWVSLRGVGYSDTGLELGGMQFTNMVYGRPPDTDEDSDDSFDYDAQDLDADWSGSDDPEGDDVVEEVGEGTSRDTYGGGNSSEMGAQSQDDRHEGHHSSTDMGDTSAGEQGYDGLDDSADESNDDQDDNDNMSDLDEVQKTNVSDTLNMNSALELAPGSKPQCYCDDEYAWDDLADNGYSVTKARWKRWEGWVAKKRCQRGHDPAPETVT